MTEKRLKINDLQILTGINILLLIFRILWVLYGNIHLNSDEAQYWLWSRQPDLSYYSKPPMIAYANYLSTWLLGDTEIGIRINAILIGFMLPIIQYKLVMNLFNDKKTAFWSVIILFSMPHYHYLSMIFTTDSLVYLFWSLAILLSWKAMQSNQWKYWILSGITLGLGIISKYTMLIWVPSFVLIGWTENRNLLKMSRFYTSLLIAFIICIPVLYWNLSQDFVGVKHILGLMGAYKPPVPLPRSVGKMFIYVAGQLACLSPFYIPALILIFRKWKNKELNNDLKPLNFLLIPIILVWGLFFILSFKKNYMNWTFFAFTSIPVLIAYSVVRFFNSKKRIMPTVLTSLIVSLLLFPQLFDLTGLKSLYPPHIDLYHKQTGWKELGGHVSKIWEGTGTDSTFIFSDNYHISAELAFYVDNQPQTYCINDGRRMNQFDLWPGIEQFSGKGFGAIYVSFNPIPDWLEQSFQKTKLVKIQSRLYRECEIKSPFFIYQLSGFKNFNTTTEPSGY
ncbi:ArnT family glycosyltransferase [Gaoshiqia sp. Z1-71]|uniref:ArnT family glycosyltransferase n=1 Tax=Gaoshiqia hydrogeniformans TaxID=3290090 RepID=UPI003BF7B653